MNVLVLTRRQGERICVGEDIIVEVVRLEGDRVRLGFIAPDDVKIVRGELLDVIQASKERFQETTP